jgi:hypothetical protein
MIKSVTKARTSAVALLLTMRMTTSTKAWTCTRTGSRRTKGTVEGTGNAEPLTLSAANSPTAHIVAWTTNLPEGVVGGGAGVEVAAGAVGERLLLALMRRTTVATATTTGNPVISVAVAEGVGVAEDVGLVEGVVERSLRCVGVGVVGVGELSSRCAAVGDVGVVELSSRCTAVGVGGVAVEVGVVRDDHYHRSINGTPNER